MFAVLPRIGRAVGLKEIQVGAIIAASSIVFFVASPLWGRLSNRLGRRRIFIIGQFGYVIGGLRSAARQGCCSDSVDRNGVAFAAFELDYSIERGCSSGVRPYAFAGLEQDHVVVFGERCGRGFERRTRVEIARLDAPVRQIHDPRVVAEDPHGAVRMSRKPVGSEQVVMLRVREAVTILDDEIREHQRECRR